MCSVLHLLLALWTATSPSHGELYTLGYLTGSQRRPGDLHYSRPGVSISGAMSLAVDHVNRELAEEGAQHRLDFIVAETYGEELESIRQTVDLLWKNVSGYIGPQETCVHEGLLAASFNVPIISYFCTHQETSDKKMFPTFARTRPPATQVSKSLAALLLAFDWTKVLFLHLDSEEDRQMRQVADTIISTLAESNVTVLDTRTWDVQYQHSYSTSPFTSIVEETYQDARIYVILGTHDEHLGLISALESRYLLSGGDYFVVGVQLETYEDADPGRYLRGLLRDDTEAVVVRGMASYLGVAPTPPVNFHDFSVLVNEYMAREPFHFINPTISLGIGKVIQPEAAYLYDAVKLYSRGLQEVLLQKGDPRNGTALIDTLRGTHYMSAMGYMGYLDKNGDAEGNYTILARQPHHLLPGQFGLYPFGIFSRRRPNKHGTSLPTVVLPKEFEWVGQYVPLAEPPCGFRGEQCNSHTGRIAGTVTATILVLFAIASLIFYRNWRYEQELDSLLWKVDFKDIQMNEEEMANSLGTKVTRATHPLIRTSQVSLSSNPDADFRYSAIYTTIGIYKGRVFAVKKVKKKSIDITRSMKKDLKMMRDLRHDNLNGFIGACTEAPNICIVTEYCTRGSLRDILENEDVKLDNMFVASLVGDIVRGMLYLHDSPVRVHGRLKTANCLVDSRWVLKLADFGLQEFKRGEETSEEAQAVAKRLEGLLYRAPELLRQDKAKDQEQESERVGTQKGDVYSFSIILFELHSRHGPFGESGFSHREIVNKVLQQDCTPPFRPSLDALEQSFDFVRDCLKECWAEEPDERPDFKSIRTKLRPMRKGMKPNIFDNMMSMMEKYANNLEALVDDRTDQLVEEKKKTEALLYEMLPRSVAEQLKRGNKVEAENFDSVTIYFSDIVGFTAMSAESTPLQIVDLLNDLYTCFDSTIENYDVYKVETIGDAYMVVSGLPIRNGDQHAGEIASMSLHLLEAVTKFQIRHRPGERLMLRIGIHSGPVCAGVVGLKMPRYCLFGDTVNTASRMESTGTPGHIHCSTETKALLDRLGGYTLEERGVVLMKGKGDKLTYWLTGEEEVKREQRVQERATRRHKHKQTTLKPEVQGGQIGPRSSLKSKHLDCSARRSPLARCSSLESPKKLRFASVDLLEFHPVSKDPLLEVIADNSPKKKFGGLLHVYTTPVEHVRRTSSSCPCIENFDMGPDSMAAACVTPAAQFLAILNNNNNSTSSSVPALHSAKPRPLPVSSAPSSPRSNININIYIDPDEINISTPLLENTA